MSTYEPLVFDQDNPLVSILVYNYNYGRYLEECLESIANQTYSNIEIIFSDNASTDNSWQIAMDFVKKYPGKMTITRNRRNLGVDANFRNCVMNIRGKYFINMCSDDAMSPDYVEKCVRVMESNHKLAFVMVHRGIIDENSQLTEEAPFYNRSCEIEGHDQAAVYMMAAVNPSVSQIMYDTHKVMSKAATGVLVSRWYGTRILDFNACMEYAIAYLKEPLLLHRIHGENDSLSAADSLLEVIGPYVLHHQFADTASNYDADQVVERLPASIEKLAKLSLRYSIRALGKGDEALGKRYFHLALAMSPAIESEATCVSLQRYWQADIGEQQAILTSMHATDDLVTRTVSYDPPAKSKPVVV